MPDAIKRTKSKLLGHIQSSLKKNKLNKVAKSVKVQTLNILLLVNSIFFKIMTAIDRKMLAEIAYDSREAFKTIVQKAQSALN